MNRSRTWRLLALLLAFALVAAACGSSDDESSDESSDESDSGAGEGGFPEGTLKIGLAYGVTDAALESITAKAIKSVEAVEALAEEAGMDVEIVIEDTAGDPTQGVDAANALVSQDVHCILGEARSSVTTPIVAVSKEASIPQISWGSTSPALTTIDDGDFFFRALLSDAAQGVVAADHIYNTLGARSAAVVVQNDPYGVGLGNAFTNGFEALGGTVDLRVDVDTGTTDFSAEVDEVVAAGADVIYTVLFGPEFIPLVSEMAQADAASIDKMFLADAQATTDASEGIEDLVVGLSGLRPAGGDLSAFATLYTDLTGTEPDAFSEFSFDAAVLCVAAAAAAGEYDPVAIRDAMRDVSAGGTTYGFDEVPALLAAAAAGDDVDYAGAGSSLDLDENGDVAPIGAGYSVWSFDDAGVNQDGELLIFEG
ncbi:MAG: ABC transporter substrate-binding protein [Actinomycetia bacterium]|nr:ABC transporter substrate-binding protein [Actinomycetes bacterium]